MIPPRRRDTYRIYRVRQSLPAPTSNGRCRPAISLFIAPLCIVRGNLLHFPFFSFRECVRVMMDTAINKASALVEALGYIQRFHDKVIVVKVGGSIMDD